MKVVGFATVPLLLHRPTSTVRVRTFCDPTCVTLGGGTCIEVGYHPRKKNLINVVFQDQAMYARTSFRSAKLERKKCVFGHIHHTNNYSYSYSPCIDKFWKRHGGQTKKKRMQKHVFIGSIFIPENKTVCLPSY